MIRVILADDHAVVREGLRRVLEEHTDLRVVAEVGSGEELLRSPAIGTADVAVVDISMPGPGIFALLDELRRAHPRLRNVVLSMHPESQYAVRVLRAGAAGYVSKEQSPELLVEAVRRVHAGKVYASPSLGEMLASRAGGGGPGEPHEALSDRELEVLVRLCRGQSVKAIASDLGLSGKTVSTYHSRIRAKLGLQSDAELVRYALEHGLTK